MWCCQPRRVLGNAKEEWLIGVACGAEHTLAIEQYRGRLWVWGCGGRGRLGLGDDKDQRLPVKVPLEEHGGGVVAAPSGPGSPGTSLEALQAHAGEFHTAVSLMSRTHSGDVARLL